MAAIKLAEQTDFHSQVCIVPLEMDSNTVLLNSRNTSAAPTLDSCVTCVGCITSAEEVFVRDSNEGVLRELIDAGKPLKFVLSTPAALALPLEALQVKLPQCTFETEQLEQDARAHAELDPQQHHIITHCPAVRLYILKKKPELYGRVFSCGSPLELAALQSKDVIFISTCHDRKIEAMKRGVRCFTLREFVAATGVAADAVQPLSEGFSKFELQDLLAERYGPYTAAAGLNADQQKYQFADFELVHSKGYRNLENFIRRAAKDSARPTVHFLEACPRGCFGGAHMVKSKELYAALADNTLQLQNQHFDAGSSCFEAGEMHDAAGVKVSDLTW